MSDRPILTEEERRKIVMEEWGLPLEEFDRRVREGMEFFRTPNLQQYPRPKRKP